MINKYWGLFKNSKLRLLLLVIIYCYAGLELLLFPQRVNYIVISGVGLMWFIEGVTYLLTLIFKTLEEL